MTQYSFPISYSCMGNPPSLPTHLEEVSLLGPKTKIREREETMKKLNSSEGNREEALKRQKFRRSHIRTVATVTANSSEISQLETLVLRDL